MHFNQTYFIKSISNINEALTNTNEIVFVGRSNSGKSSLINKITNQKLAFTSKLPGRTQTINYYHINTTSNNYFVDLPGYGYANTKRLTKTMWSQLISDFLITRKEISAVIIIMDIRHPLKDIDIEMIDFCFKMQERRNWHYNYSNMNTHIETDLIQSTGSIDNNRIENKTSIINDTQIPTPISHISPLSIIFVLSKADKLSNNARIQAMKLIEHKIKTYVDNHYKYSNKNINISDNNNNDRSSDKTNNNSQTSHTNKIDNNGSYNTFNNKINYSIHAISNLNNFGIEELCKNIHAAINIPSVLV